MPRTNIIIPFWQHDSGILPVAVDSVLAQDDGEILVTVIDDGSPVSARAELAVAVAKDAPIVIIEQPNAGPGAARNRGLDETPAEIEYIAFLDSDDRWLPGHLHNAKTALSKDADFYFSDADHHERGLGYSRFAECGFDGSLGEPILEGNSLFFYRGSLFDSILGSSPVGTSTVVYRRSVGLNLRFPEGLIYGEDKFLWMKLALAARRVAYSTRCEAAYGRGVNIYASATWGAPQALKKFLHVAKVHRMIASSFNLTQEQHRWNTSWLEEVRRTFAANLLHLLRHGKPVDWRVVAAYLAMDPRLASELVTTLGKGVLRLARSSR
ncbi:MAG: glycosyltransferase family A protein [Stellaceae bacterium]